MIDSFQSTVRFRQGDFPVRLIPFYFSSIYPSNLRRTKKLRPYPGKYTSVLENSV